MNYAFKMMVVILTLGALVLSGVGIAIADDKKFNLLEFSKSLLSNSKKTSVENVSNTSSFNFNDGVIAFRNQNYEKAFKIFSYRAEELNEAISQKELGALYQNGYGTSINHNKAFKLYIQAYENGDMAAANDIGICHQYGIGTEQNNALAFKYYKIASDFGNDIGHVNVGLMYFDGIHVNKNYKTAFDYFKQGAKKGNAAGYLNVGLSYLYGEGTKKNLSKAFKNLTLAADKGNTYAMDTIGLMYSKGTFVEKDSVKSFQFHKKAAELGDAQAQYNTGTLYLKGDGILKNKKKALYFFRESATQKNADGIYGLAYLYENGIGVKKHLNTATKLYFLSAKLGSTFAKNELTRLNFKTAKYSEFQKENDYIGNGWLGVEISNINDEKHPTGIRVDNLNPYGPASNILKVNDIVKKIDNVIIDNVGVLSALISETPTCSIVSVEILRDYAPLNLEIKLGHKVKQKRCETSKIISAQFNKKEAIKPVFISKNKDRKYSPLKNYSDTLIKSNACLFDGFKYTIFKTDVVSQQYVDEAKRRGLDCEVGKSNKIVTSKLEEIVNLNDNILLNYACKNGKWYTNNHKHVLEAKNRALDCVLEGIAATFKVSDNSSKNNKNTSINRDKEINNYSDYVICLRAGWREDSSKYQLEAKRRGLDCVMENENKTFVAVKPEISKPTTSFYQLESERKKRKELEKELAKLKNKQKQEQQKINTDNKKPTINVFAKQNGSNATISGRVTDNTEVAEVLIDGETQQLSPKGTFETELYVPRNGLNVEIVAFDKKGNKALKTLRLERSAVLQASGPTFDRLNPSGKRVKSNPNALALIIGVANYAKTPANALYADKDAQQFYDYATMKLGVPSSNIKELINDKADLGEILINVKEWLRRSAKPKKSDIYIYFAGHGLASQDGSKMYLLPYDGRPRLLKNTAVLRDELFKDIKQANPRSVTVFLDTCYSGVTRNKEMLIAGRPIVIIAKKQAIPNGFTLFSAASNEQISRPLEEAQHGMFSYFLMKGMEGDADSNNDNKITARELHVYVEQNVVQQSSGSQIPELQGDKDRVIVRFN